MHCDNTSGLIAAQRGVEDTHLEAAKILLARSALLDAAGPDALRSREANVPHASVIIGTFAGLHAARYFK